MSELEDTIRREHLPSAEGHCDICYQSSEGRHNGWPCPPVALADDLASTVAYMQQQARHMARLERRAEAAEAVIVRERQKYAQVAEQYNALTAIDAANAARADEWRQVAEHGAGIIERLEALARRAEAAEAERDTIKAAADKAIALTRAWAKDEQQKREAAEEQRTTERGRRLALEAAVEQIANSDPGAGDASVYGGTAVSVDCSRCEEMIGLAQAVLTAATEPCVEHQWFAPAERIDPSKHIWEWQGNYAMSTHVVCLTCGIKASEVKP